MAAALLLLSLLLWLLINISMIPALLLRSNHDNNLASQLVMPQTWLKDQRSVLKYLRPSNLRFMRLNLQILLP
jgi:hypothetical protein